jgi:hypothetical protein
MVSLTTVHADSTTMLPMHEIPSKPLPCPASTKTLAAAETFAATPSSLTIGAATASPSIGPMAIGAAKTSTGMEISMPMVKTTAARIEVLDIIAIHLGVRLPPPHGRHPSLNPFPRKA